jgi:flagella basal body P-ring formation protein FlgA
MEAESKRSAGQEALLLLATVLVMVLLVAAPRGLFAKETPADPVELELMAQVEQALPWPDAEVTLEEMRISGMLPKDGWTLELIPPTRWRSRVRAKIIPLDGGRPVWATATLNIQISALVVSRALARDEQITGAWKEARVSVDNLPHDAITDPGELAGLVARTPLIPGRVIRRSMLLSPQLITRGQTVHVLVSRGSVQITDRAIALQSGRLGDPVRVQSASTQKVLTGVVREDGSVEIP